MQVGSRVICIDSGIKADALLSVSEHFQQWVVKGNKYTVREIVDNDGIVDGVLLEEISNKPIAIKLLGGKIQEPAFALWRFRELQDDVVAEEVYEESNEYVY